MTAESAGYLPEHRHIRTLKRESAWRSVYSWQIFLVDMTVDGGSLL